MSMKEAVDSPSFPSKRRGESPAASERSAKTIWSEVPAPGGIGATAGSVTEPGKVNSPEKDGQVATRDAATEAVSVASVEAVVVEEGAGADVAAAAEGTGTSAGFA